MTLWLKIKIKKVSQVEANIVSVERVEKYINELEQERPRNMPKDDSKFYHIQNWIFGVSLNQGVKPLNFSYKLCQCSGPDMEKSSSKPFPLDTARSSLWWWAVFPCASGPGTKSVFVDEPERERAGLQNIGYILLLGWKKNLEVKKVLVKNFWA